MPSQNVTTTVLRPPKEQEAVDRLLDTSLLGVNEAGLPGGREFFPGDTVAGFNPNQTGGQQTNLDAVQGGLVSQGIDQALQSNLALSDIGTLLSDPNALPGVADFRRNTIEQGVRQLGEGLLPQLNLGSITAGGFGGSRNQIGQALAAERVADATGRTLNNFDTNLFSQLLNANTGALNRAPGIAGLGLVPGQIQQEIGGAQQAQEQAELLGDRERFEFGQNEPFFLNDQLRASLGLLPTGQSQGTKVPGPGLGELLLGGGSILAGTGVLDGLLDGIFGTGKTAQGTTP